MKDEDYMRRALEISMKGNPSPNPYVGALVVKDGKIISEGYHEKAGMPHAEAQALAGVDARGATLYVTLEPCSHYGRTPPCTKTIMAAGVKRVVYAVDDPTDKVAGRQELEAAGIEVEEGVLRQECMKANEAFFKYSRTGLPFVALKAAITLDGQIAASSGDSKWITNEKSREVVHKLRSGYDAVVVGANTVLRDNPRLTSRIDGGRDPLRIVLDSTCRTPADSNIFADKNALIATTKNYMPENKKKLEAKAEVVVFEGANVDLKSLLTYLGKKGVTSVLVEGGANVFTSFLNGGFVDKFIFFVAPKIMGGVNKPVYTGGGLDFVKDAFNLSFSGVSMVDGDIMIEAYPK